MKISELRKRVCVNPRAVPAVLLVGTMAGSLNSVDGHAIVVLRVGSNNRLYLADPLSKSTLQPSKAVNFSELKQTGLHYGSWLGTWFDLAP